MNTNGLSTDQAPPLRVPLQFLALIPVAVVVAAALVVSKGVTVLATGWLPATIALTHLLTLGVVGAALLGSLYQLVPVVAGRSVPWPAVSHVTAALWFSGTTAFTGGLVFDSTVAIGAGAGALGLALLAFLGPVGVALLRAPVRSDTVLGMRLGLVCLAVLAALGLRLAWGHAGGTMPAARVSLLAAHAGLGLFGVVGALIAAVGWQVLPMFSLTEAPGRRLTRPIAGVLAVSPIAAAVVALAGAPPLGVGLALLPAALTAWWVHPALQLRAISRRKRRRADPSLDFWRLGLVSGLLSLPAAGLFVFSDWSPAGPLLGFVVLWGWAFGIVHGMVSRIVPFLLWFHAVARTDDITQVPPMKRLWPDTAARRQFVAHGATFVVGVVAVSSGVDVLVRVTGLGMLCTGALLGHGMFAAVRRAAGARRGD